jgi:hypothetical protein
MEKGERKIEKGDAPAALPKAERVLDDTSCADGNGCFWSLVSYGGTKFTASAAFAGTWYSLGTCDRSAKNRFADRRIQLGQYLGNGSYAILDCLNPGNNNSNLAAAIDSFKIGAQGTSC